MCHSLVSLQAIIGKKEGLKKGTMFAGNADRG
jgi:hypothetical protein